MHTRTHTTDLVHSREGAMYSAYNWNRPCNPITYNKNNTEVPAAAAACMAEGTAKANDGKHKAASLNQEKQSLKLYAKDIFFK